MQETIIRFENVKKEYRLGQFGSGTLYRDLQSWMAKIRGKEDPNVQIGSDTAEKGAHFLALNGISFEVKKGEALGIIGHNGAGKSTLLKLLCRVTTPTEGTISYNGRIASMLEVGTGFNGEMTGRENIYMNGAILGMTKAEINKKMDDIIEFSEVHQFIDTPVKRYSSGMYVKLAFSVAAHLDSEIMIMDEVLAVGDMAFQKKCLEKMRSVATQEGRTVLYVSHNMNTIRQLCDRCIVLDKGKIIFDGDVEEAIGVYQGASAVSDNVVDLSCMKRRPEFMPHPVTMEKLEIDTDNSVFGVGNKLSGSIFFVSISPLSHVHFDIALRSKSGSSVTKYSLPCELSIAANTNYALKFEIDITKIAPGQYTLSPAFFSQNNYGGISRLDGLHDAYCFEIATEENFNDGREWNPAFDGYYIAPDISGKLVLL